MRQLVVEVERELREARVLLEQIGRGAEDECVVDRNAVAGRAPSALSAAKNTAPITAIPAALAICVVVP